MKIDGQPAQLVRCRAGLTLRWRDTQGKIHVAFGEDAHVDAADKSKADVQSSKLDSVKLRQVF